jgi:hypothetical protein
MSEYGIGTGLYDGGYYANGGLVADLDDPAIQTELCNEVTDGDVPAPAFSGQELLYVIYLPNGLHSTRNGTQSSGYHDSFLCNGARLYYAELDGYDAASTDLVAAHEVSEAATDSILGQGWNVPGKNEGEIADLCAPGNEVIDGRLVPTLWSQKSCGCK